MTGGVPVVTDEENLSPEILLQAVLGFDRSEIIAGRHDAAVQDNEVIFAGGEDDGLLGAGAESETGQEDGGVIGDFGEQDRSSWRVKVIMVFITPALLFCEELFCVLQQKRLARKGPGRHRRPPGYWGKAQLQELARNRARVDRGFSRTVTISVTPSPERAGLQPARSGSENSPR